LKAQFLNLILRGKILLQRLELFRVLAFMDRFASGCFCW
jgi:hypothetical protein